MIRINGFLAFAACTLVITDLIGGLAAAGAGLPGDIGAAVFCVDESRWTRLLA
jgi:hypothetical protein